MTWCACQDGTDKFGEKEENDQFFVQRGAWSLGSVACISNETEICEEIKYGWLNIPFLASASLLDGDIFQ